MFYNRKERKCMVIIFIYCKKRVGGVDVWWQIKKYWSAPESGSNGRRRSNSEIGADTAGRCSLETCVRRDASALDHTVRERRVNSETGNRSTTPRYSSCLSAGSRQAGPWLGICAVGIPLWSDLPPDGWLIGGQAGRASSVQGKEGNVRPFWILIDRYSSIPFAFSAVRLLEIDARSYTSVDKNRTGVACPIFSRERESCVPSSASL